LCHRDQLWTVTLTHALTTNLRNPPKLITEIHRIRRLY